MTLIRLLYVSDATRPFLGREIDALVAKSRSNNDALGITGILLNSGGQFLQVLEGDEPGVLALFDKIRRDPRHNQVHKLLFHGTDKRLFPKWGMELINAHPWRKQGRQWLDNTLTRLRSGICENEAREMVNLLHEFREQFSSCPR